MTPIEWAVLPLKRYSQFSGRAPRAEYWWFIGAMVGCSALLDLLASGLISGSFTLVMLVPSLAVTVRRLHDSDRKGWWIFVYIVPFVAAMAVGIWASLNNVSTDRLTGLFMTLGFGMIGGILVLLIFMGVAGTHGPNRYGPDPFDPDELEEVFA